jgi:hypothetical protein
VEGHLQATMGELEGLEVVVGWGLVVLLGLALKGRGMMVLPKVS